MDQIHRIRELYYGQEKTLKEIADIMNCDWRTVRKYVDKEDFNTSPPAPASAAKHESKAYIHKRCMEASFDYIDSESLPSSLDEVMELLLQLEEERKPVGQKYYALSEFFRTCDKNSVTLTFKQIEEIMGEPLGASALRKEYWYRTGFMNISQCWLDNGYEIKALHLEDRKRVVFHITSDNKNTSSVDIPEVLKYQRIPNEAKYELENYFQYIIKKYGL